MSCLLDIVISISSSSLLFIPSRSLSLSLSLFLSHYFSFSLSSLQVFLILAFIFFALLLLHALSLFFYSLPSQFSRSCAENEKNSHFFLCLIKTLTICLAYSLLNSVFFSLYLSFSRTHNSFYFSTHIVFSG